MSAPEEIMPIESRRNRKWRWVVGAIGAVVLIFGAIQLPSVLHKKDAQAAAADTTDDSKKLALVPGELPTVKMPADMVQRLGVKTAEVEILLRSTSIEARWHSIDRSQQHGSRPFSLSRRNRGNWAFRSQ